MVLAGNTSQQRTSLMTEQAQEEEEEEDFWQSAEQKLSSVFSAVNLVRKLGFPERETPDLSWSALEHRRSASIAKRRAIDSETSSKNASLVWLLDGNVNL